MTKTEQDRIARWEWLRKDPNHPVGCIGTDGTFINAQIESWFLGAQAAQAKAEATERDALRWRTLGRTSMPGSPEDQMICALCEGVEPDDDVMLRHAQLGLMLDQVAAAFPEGA